MREGETLGLIGPNGAGKTTQLECLTVIFSKDVTRATIAY